MTARDVRVEPATGSWVPGVDEHPDFGLANLPFGVFSTGDDDQRGGIRVGDGVLDLRGLARSGLLAGAALAGARAASGSSLNAFFALGAGPRRALRTRVQSLLGAGSDARGQLEPLLVPADEARMQLPAAVGDYTDFYVGIHHAQTVGSLFRPDNPLLPNYKWVPIGYHGRASSVRVSGEPFPRPQGQLKPAGEVEPRFGPCRNLDFELELGIWLGEPNASGRPIPVAQASEHVAGYCLLNDWSARDIQSWEYQPLGPFLSKNFATTVSAWVVTPEALAPFRTSAFSRPPGDPAPLPYLSDPADQAEGGIELELEVLIATEQMRRQGRPAHRLSASSTRHMYWTVAQLIAHHTSGGCDLRAGDLFGTGTLSGPDQGSRGSMMELTANGAEPLALPGGQTRRFLADGDEITLRARATGPGQAPVGFGECRALVLPAV